MGNLNFDATDVEPADGGSYEPLPKGDYLMFVKDSEVLPTKAGTGTILKLTMEIASGLYENRLIFQNLNIANPNETAQKIGLGQLSALCRAIGKMQVQDSKELHFVKFNAAVDVETQTGTDSNGKPYGPRNVIKKFYPKDAATSAVSGGVTATTTATNKAPWEK